MWIKGANNENCKEKYNKTLDYKGYFIYQYWKCEKIDFLSLDYNFIVAPQIAILILHVMHQYIFPRWRLEEIQDEKLGDTSQILVRHTPTSLGVSHNKNAAADDVKEKGNCTW